MQLVTEIEDYIELLKKRFNLRITLHPRGNEVLVSGSRLIKYNIHTSPYCLQLKAKPEIHRLCLECQKKICGKLRHCAVFSGMCHGGVTERVYGIFSHGELLCFISVSGYSGGEEGRCRAKEICTKFRLSSKAVLDAYDEFDEHMPDEPLLDSVIMPLCRMIELGNVQLSGTEEIPGLYIKLLRYINANFCQDISVSMLAGKFGVSPSTISHLFKRRRGVSIREYITALRVESAGSLLSATDMSVTDIAYITGFSDCSYFINVFKKNRGVTPAQFRKISCP